MRMVCSDVGYSCYVNGSISLAMFSFIEILREVKQVWLNFIIKQGDFNFVLKSPCFFSVNLLLELKILQYLSFICNSGELSFFLISHSFCNSYSSSLVVVFYKLRELHNNYLDLQQLGADS